MTEFEKILREKQRELGLSARAFSAYLGISRTSLYIIYSNAKLADKKTLFPQTMARIYNKIGMPYKVMEKYNEQILASRNSENLEKDSEWLD